MLDRFIFALALFFIPFTLVTLAVNIAEGDVLWSVLGSVALVLWIFNITMSWPTTWKPLKKR